MRTRYSVRREEVVELELEPKRLADERECLEDAAHGSGRASPIGVLIEQHHRVDRGPRLLRREPLTLPSPINLCM